MVGRPHLDTGGLSLALAGLLFLLVCGPAGSARALTLSQVPLPTAASARPNIMLLLDNSGSMNNVVPDAPFDPATSYLETCPQENLVSTSEQVELRLSGGQPQFYVGGSSYIWGTATGQRCFAPTGRYLAKLAADGGSAPTGYLPGEYRGNFLNWYFQVGNTTPAWGAGQQKKPGTATRMEIAKGAATALLDTLNGVRVGLATYNGSNGATILQGMTDIASGRSLLKTRVAGLTASGATPLAEALRDIGDYFAQGQNGPLVLYPDSASPQSVTKSTIFSRGYGFSPPAPAPIEVFCQKNFAVLMTDGRPTNDNDISTVLQDYDGDCRNANPPCLSFDRKPGQSYESSGTDFLDDVALALRDIDLRPDLNDKKNQPVKNNLITYTIGFADDQVINDPLMRDTAANGGGRFFTAAKPVELSAAFANAANFIVSGLGSSTSVAVSGPKLVEGSLVFQAIYSSGNWTGDLLAYRLDKLTGAVLDLKWEASKKLPVTRKLLTWNPESGKGVDLQWDLLGSTQQAALAVGPTGTADGHGSDRLAYLRGDTSREERFGGVFRNRVSLLGDIVNADPAYVGNQNYGYDRLPGSEGASYPDYRGGLAKNRPAMLYVGANDGFLHAFAAESGDEIFAFMPAAVLPQANQLTFPNYGHRFFVDGPPRPGDAFIGGGWRTLLLGTPGAGGRGLYALDITDPENFSEKNVLWEITNSPNLGYVLGQPTAVRLAGDRWVAVTGNGYGSDGQRAMLLIHDLATGTLLKALDTGFGSSAAPNGLSSPVPADLDGDRITEFVYAGDLQGNLWKFDLRSADPANWSVAVGGKPLFTARDNSGRVQPITSRPAVGRHSRGGAMIYFGTGKYFEVGDNDPSRNLAIESFYGIWDNGTSAERSNLVRHTITGEFVDRGKGVRTTTAVGSGDGTRGCYLDLAFPAGQKSGERVVSSPLLRHGRVIFPSIIPSNAACDPGGISWLMELDALTCGRLEYSAFDLDDNRRFTEDDYVDAVEDGKAVRIPISGVRQETLIDTPGVVQGDDWEVKYMVNPDGTLKGLLESSGNGIRSGRRSWRQLQ